MGTGLWSARKGPFQCEVARDAPMANAGYFLTTLFGFLVAGPPL